MNKKKKKKKKKKRNFCILLLNMDSHLTSLFKQNCSLIYVKNACKADLFFYHSQTQNLKICVSPGNFPGLNVRLC